MMGKIVWNKAFSVESKYLDKQHKQLIEIVNSFNQALDGGERATMAFEVLNRLVRYAEQHFRDEEKILQMVQYPADQFQAHVREHEKLTEDIYRHCENWSSVGEESLPGIGQFLKDWLVNHILNTDMQYCKYTRNFDDSFMSVT
ncbi:MAG: bacteriohemerythrin [Proteobacteria bacterium]|nr:bacteriohemerythrin [Pseudomonadota bacterium]MBU1686627.1 bacteriohemerythrin [Pseudomonadota bacterium]